MKNSHGILIEFRTAVDYCLPFQPNHEITNHIVDYCYEYGIQLDMTIPCWRDLCDSITNALNFFLYLRDRATETLRELPPSEALDLYIESTLNHSNLNSQDDLSLNAQSLPDLNELRDAVRNIGIRRFRAYIDSQMQGCSMAQNMLDLRINRRFERGGSDPYLFNASIIGTISKEKDRELLLNAYDWGTGENRYLITRKDSELYSKKDTIYQYMQNKKFDIICPEDVDRQIS